MREERRTQVLQAAVAQFARNGFAGTSTVDVARAAGVSQATIFVYFPSKEDLFRAAVTEPLAPSLQRVAQLLASPSSPRERVELLAQVMLTSFAREEAYLRLVQYVGGLRDRFPDVAGEIIAFTDRCTELLARTIAEGQAAGQFLPGNATQRALHFYAFLQGCGLIYQKPPDDPIWEDAVHAALRLIAFDPSAQ